MNVTIFMILSNVCLNATVRLRCTAILFLSNVFSVFVVSLGVDYQIIIIRDGKIAV